MLISDEIDFKFKKYNNRQSKALYIDKRVNLSR